MSNSVEISNLSKSYGKLKVLQSINLNVPAGAIYGLIGPNGAGKTTLIKAIVGATNFETGKISVLGLDPANDKWTLRKQIGYMPQTPSLYGDLTAYQNISFFGKAHGIKNLNEEVERALAFTELTDRKNDLVRNFSGGMAKRVSLACTLIHKPKIIFLDEPTAAVDPQLKQRTWALFRKLSQEGVTIFVSTHLMDEAMLCDKVTILRQGEVLLVDTPQNILAKGKTKISVTRNGAKTELISGSSPTALASELKKFGLDKGIENITLTQDNIEDIILDIVNKK